MPRLLCSDEDRVDCRYCTVEKVNILFSFDGFLEYSCTAMVGMSKAPGGTFLFQLARRERAASIQDTAQASEVRRAGGWPICGYCLSLLL